MSIFKNKEEYRNWIEEQDWYQTIKLPCGLKTSGKVSTDQRLDFFDKIDFKNKTVLDIGCNSGQYCFMAKDRGASRVVGIDINEKRINQAKILAENENYDVEFVGKGLFDVENQKFDIVLCIAVLTEIQDIFGAIKKLKEVIGERAYIELDLAKPLIYLSCSKNWLRGYPRLSRQKAITEIRQRNDGDWMVSPTLEIVSLVFGDDFKLKHKKGAIRYDLIEVIRKK